MDNLICVDILDREIGKATKEECHQKGLLHRAFSVFLYHEGKLLLQRRALEKYHSGGLWTNACCSHPRYQESLEEAVNRRLYQELGITLSCEEAGSFIYYHKFHNEMFEYEYDHVFIGQYYGEISPDPEEIMDLKWMEIADLSESMLQNPEQYTVWFLTAAPMVIRKLMSGKVPG